MVGRPKSCTPCRQAKVACDARRHTPNPCSRCISKSLECRFDNYFKRVSTRQIAQDIANELCTIQVLPSPLEAASPLTKIQPPSFLLSSDVESPSEFELDRCSIDSQVIVELFQHFGRYYYYPHAQFLSPVHSLSRFYSESPLLFWTIVLIASQHHEKHRNLNEALFSSHRGLLTPLIDTSVRSINQIHALLLLCLWPIPRQEGLSDPSWSYIGIAVNACVRMNLHKPRPQNRHLAQGLTPWSSSHESMNNHVQRLTWLACFSIGTHVATFIGSMPTISSQHQLKHVRNAIDELGCLMTPEYRASLAIHEITCNYSISLEDIEDPSTHYSHTQIFDGSLDSIKLSYVAHWSPELEEHLQYAKLNLFAMTFLLPQPVTNRVDPQTVINRNTIALLGLESAMNLISQVKTISLRPMGQGEPIGAVSLVFYPKHYFAHLVFASAFIFRVLVDHGLSSKAHRARGIQGIVEAHKILRFAPYHLDAMRAARLLEIFVEKARSAEQSPKGREPSIQLSITDRMGASLLWDSIPLDEFKLRRDIAAGIVPIPECGGSSTFEADSLTLAPGMKEQLPDSLPFLGPRPGQDQGMDSWTSWDAYINDSIVDTDPQLTW